MWVVEVIHEQDLIGVLCIVVASLVGQLDQSV